MPPIPQRHFQKIRAAEHVITHLQAMNLSYKLGGGRNCNGICHPRDFSANGPGGDCSWLQLLVCDILEVHLKDPVGWTGTLVKEGHPGPGKMYSIYIKDPFNLEGHTIGRFHHPKRDHWFECGGRDNPQPGDGVSWFIPTRERIREFTRVRHFQGF